MATLTPVEYFDQAMQRYNEGDFDGAIQYFLLVPGGHQNYRTAQEYVSLIQRRNNELANLSRPEDLSTEQDFITQANVYLSIAKRLQDQGQRSQADVNYEKALDVATDGIATLGGAAPNLSALRIGIQPFVRRTPPAPPGTTLQELMISDPTVIGTTGMPTPPTATTATTATTGGVPAGFARTSYMGGMDDVPHRTEYGEYANTVRQFLGGIDPSGKPVLGTPASRRVEQGMLAGFSDQHTRWLLDNIVAPVGQKTEFAEFLANTGLQRAAGTPLPSYWNDIVKIGSLYKSIVGDDLDKVGKFIGDNIFAKDLFGVPTADNQGYTGELSDQQKWAARAAMGGATSGYWGGINNSRFKSMLQGWENLQNRYPGKFATPQFLPWVVSQLSSGSPGFVEGYSTREAFTNPPAATSASAAGSAFQALQGAGVNTSINEVKSGASALSTQNKAALSAPAKSPAGLPEIPTLPGLPKGPDVTGVTKDGVVVTDDDDTTDEPFKFLDYQALLEGKTGKDLIYQKQDGENKLNAVETGPIPANEIFTSFVDDGTFEDVTQPSFVTMAGADAPDWRTPATGSGTGFSQQAESQLMREGDPWDVATGKTPYTLTDRSVTGPRLLDTQPGLEQLEMRGGQYAQDPIDAVPGRGPRLLDTQPGLEQLEMGGGLRAPVTGGFGGDAYVDPLLGNVRAPITPTSFRQEVRSPFLEEKLLEAAPTQVATSPVPFTTMAGTQPPSQYFPDPNLGLMGTPSTIVPQPAPRFGVDPEAVVMGTRRVPPQLGIDPSVLHGAPMGAPRPQPPQPISDIEMAGMQRAASPYFRQQATSPWMDYVLEEENIRPVVRSTTTPTMPGGKRVVNVIGDLGGAMIDQGGFTNLVARSQGSPVRGFAQNVLSPLVLQQLQNMQRAGSDVLGAAETVEPYLQQYGGLFPSSIPVQW